MTTNRTVEEKIAAIEALDLDPIKFKLMDKKEGMGWSRAKVDAVALEYRRFLSLTARYPGEAITPDTDVDRFWHAHILDTIKYAQDCQDVFGYFLHHFPYFGMRGQEDAERLAVAGKNTKRLYEQTFGVMDSKETAFCGATEATTFCGATGATAFCGATGATAFCGATGATAFCGATGATAFCGATAGPLEGLPALSAKLLDVETRPRLQSAEG